MEKQNQLQRSNLGTLKLINEYIIDDIKRNSRSFKIGVFTIFLVVSFAIILKSGVDLSLVIFLKIGESSLGEQDLILLPSSLNQAGSNPLINATKVQQSCDKVEGIYGCTPRWYFFGDLTSEKQNTPLRSNIILFNSQLEKSIGLGRNLESQILKNNEVLITSSVQKILSLKKNNRIFLNLSLEEFYQFLPVSIPSETGFQQNPPQSEVQLLIIKRLQQLQLTQQQINLITAIISILPQQQLQILDFQFEINTSTLKTLLQQLTFTIQFLGPTAALNIIQTTLNLPQDQLQIITPFVTTQNIQLLNTVVQSLPDNQTVDQESVVFAFVDIIVAILFNFRYEFVVVQSVEDGNGKWTSSIGNVLAADSESFIQTTSESLAQTYETQSTILRSQNPSASFLLLDFVITQGDLFRTPLNFDINNFAFTQNVVIENRLNVYNQKYLDIQGYFVNLSNKFVYSYGKDQLLEGATVLLLFLKNLQFFTDFLDQVLGSAVFILVMLCILLIYSLMLSDVDEKTYEFGMLRALGFQKQNLMVLLIIQALTYAIPGLTLGYIFAFMIQNIIKQLTFGFANEASSYDLSLFCILLGLFLGLLMPIISNIVPIQRALSKNLRDSLDMMSRVINELTIKVFQLESLGISVVELVMSLTLIGIGKLIKIINQLIISQQLSILNGFQPLKYLFPIIYKEQ